MLKNRYNKIRSYISWHYPLAYDRLCAAKFPLQLLAVGIAMLLAVGFYNAHYSHNAILANSRAKTNNTVIATADTSQATMPKVSTQAGQATNSRVSLTGSANQSGGQLEATLTESEEVLQRQVAKAESLLKEKEQQAKRLEQKVESAKNLLRASDQNPQSNSPDLKLHSIDWMQELPADHFVAQIAAATEQQLLIDYAADGQFNQPLAIYPFKVNKDGELVYGLSTGLFIVKDDAIAELPVLSEKSEQHGVWVRKVADIKDQLSTLKKNRILQ